MKPKPHSMRLRGKEHRIPDILLLVCVFALLLASRL